MKTAKGFVQLRSFVRRNGLSVTDLHKGLVRRFGAKRVGSYERVYSWVKGERRPDEGAREMLRIACGIDLNAWQSKKESKREEWLADKRSR